MLSSGRYAIVGVQDIRKDLARKISAPASLPGHQHQQEQQQQQQEGQLVVPRDAALLSPVKGHFPSSQTWPPSFPGRQSHDDAAVDAAAAALDRAKSQDDDPGQTTAGPTKPAELVVEHAAVTSNGSSSERTNGTRGLANIETNATASGRLLADDEVDQEGTSAVNTVRGAAGEESREGEGLSSGQGVRQKRPSFVPSLRLDLAPEGAEGALVREDPVLGRVLAPLRSPFASDDSAPNTPRVINTIAEPERTPPAAAAPDASEFQGLVYSPDAAMDGRPSTERSYTR